MGGSGLSGLRGLLLAVVVLAGVGCSERYEPFAQNQIDVALDAASRVRTKELAPLIRAIYEARLTDPERDLSYSDRCGTGKACVYSRAAARALLEERWSADELGATTSLHEQRRTEGGFETTNVFLDIPGRSRPGEWVLASAHYDAWFGGAIDDASGVAVVSEAAYALAGMALDRSVRLLLFDGEELGMVGSGRYTEEHGVDGVTLLINADMVAFVAAPGGVLTGESASVDYWVQANEKSAAAAHQMTDLARRLPAPLSLKPLVFPDDGVSVVGAVVGVDLSDHAQFWLAGVPALFPFPPGDKPSWYHTARDTPEVVDVGRLERTAQLWAASLAAFATVAEP